MLNIIIIIEEGIFAAISLKSFKWMGVPGGK